MDALKKIPASLAAFSVSLLLLGGCCLGVNCDCITAGVYISYQDTSSLNQGSPRQGPLTMEVWSVGSESQAVVERVVYLNGDNSAYLFPDPRHYWVLKSDSLGISDTLRIRALSIKDGRRACCSCGPWIESIEYEVNGQVYTNPEISRSY